MIKRLFFKFRRFITFGIVGIINTLVDLAFFAIAFSLLGLGDQSSQVIGYCCGILCSFILNRRLTFTDGTRRLWGQIFLFILVNLISLLLSVELIALLTGLFVRWADGSALFGWLVMRELHVYLAKGLVTVAIMVVNYFGYKYIVFRVNEKGQERND